MLSGKEKGKTQIKVFSQIMIDMGFRTYREIKKLTWDRNGGKSLQTSLRSENSMMMNKTYRIFLIYRIKIIETRKYIVKSKDHLLSRKLIV